MLVKNIRAGSGNSSPGNLFNANGTLYFRADDGVVGQELWKSDGTAAGTVLVKNIRSSGQSSPQGFIILNGKILFEAFEDASGWGLWTTDGTEAGTVLVKGFGTAGDLISQTNVNGTLFFGTNDGSGLGRELWKSDGTTVGTVLVKDIFPGSSSSNPNALTNVNGILLFAATDGVKGTELWASSGVTDVLANDTDVDSTALTAQLVNGPSHGTLTLNSDGTFVYKPNAGYNGTDIFTYQASDGTNLSNVATVTLNVVGANTAPVLAPVGSKTVDEGTLLTFTAVATDADLLSFSLAGTVPAGASIDAITGVFTWTPTEAQGPGIYSFDVVVTDDGLPALSDSETITVTVYENQPTAAFTVTPNPAAPGQPLTFNASASSHGRPDRSIVLYEWDLNGTPGVDIITTSPTVTYAYPLFGSFTVTLTVTDNNSPAKTDTETHVVDVNQGNLSPIANAGGPYLADLGEPLTLNGTASTDPNLGQGDAIVSYQWLVNNSIALSGPTPTLSAAQINALGIGSFFSVRLTVTDSFGATNIGTSYLSVSQINDAPAGTDKTITINEDTPYTFSAADFSFSDPNDSPANSFQAVKITTLPGTGTLTFNGNLVNAGDLVSPDPTPAGAIWTAHESNRQWYSVASSADATRLVAAVYGGQLYTSTDVGVTWTARESNRSWTSVASSTDGTKLVATVNGGQLYTSTDAGVTWTARESNRQWVSFASSVDGTQLVAAVANGGQLYTSTDAGVTWTARESNRNWFAVASSADGTQLVAGVIGGQLYTSAAQQGLVYTPAANANGTNYASFTFQVQDNGGTANGGVDLDQTPNTITFNVAAVNDLPAITSAANVNAPENQTAVTTVTATDADLPSQTLTFSLIGGTDQAKFAITTGGVLTFQTSPNFETPTDANLDNVYEVTVQVSDGAGGIATQTLSVTVANVNEAPVGTDDFYTAKQDTTFVAGALLVKDIRRFRV